MDDGLKNFVSGDSYKTLDEHGQELMDHTIDCYVQKIKMEMSETMDNFIFASLDPFISQYTEIKISKQELIEAIELIRMRREALDKYGSTISDDKLTITQHMADLRTAYNHGREDGIKYANEKLRNMLDNYRASLEDLYGKKED